MFCDRHVLDEMDAPMMWGSGMVGKLKKIKRR